MRDLILLAVILGSLPFCVMRPYLGIYMWYWVSIMNPHRLAFGFMYRFPVALAVAAATIIGSLSTKDRARIPWERETILILSMLMLFTVSTVLALYPSLAWGKWDEVLKMLVMTFLTLILINTREKLRIVLLVISFSIGFFGMKGALFGVLTAGQYRLWGPPSSAIADNNALGLALNMSIPLLLFFAQHETDRRVRFVAFAAFLCAIFSVILTYSRGGFLGLAVVLFLLNLQSRKRLLLPLLLAPILIGIYSFMPAGYLERIGTIGAYQEDESAMSRIETWTFAWGLALSHPLLGGGFHAFRANPSDYDAHSIYFGMLGEQGFTGLFLFVALIASAYASCSYLARVAKHYRSFQWYGDLARMLKVSFAAYSVSGTFLNLQYFDLFYVLVGVVIIMKSLVRKEFAERAAQETEAIPSAGQVVALPGGASAR